MAEQLTQADVVAIVDGRLEDESDRDEISSVTSDVHDLQQSVQTLARALLHLLDGDEDRARELARVEV